MAACRVAWLVWITARWPEWIIQTWLAWLAWLATSGTPGLETNSPLVHMQTMTPTQKLDDPGIGLRDNGRRAPTYSDLRSTFPDRMVATKSHHRAAPYRAHGEFSWSFDGIKFSDAEPLRLKYGERVRITLVNDTMMTHPIHLHGMWSDLEDANGNFLVRKHTIDMPPGSKRSYRGDRRCVGALGLPLPPVAPHGNGHVP